MILQSLVSYYEILAAQGKIAKPGWSPAKVSYALVLSQDGELVQLRTLKHEEERQEKGKIKKVELPTEYQVPEPKVKAGIGAIPNFLCDGAGYLLGLGDPGKINKKTGKTRAQECFEASRALHLSLLEGVDCPEARAVAAFYQTWDTASGAQHPALCEHLDELEGSNLIFRIDGCGYAQDAPAIRAVWQERYDNQSDAEVMQCLVTGEMHPVATIHNKIKGVRDAQSAGANLVGFNAPAYESYAKEQGANAPISRYAMFAYTSALNLLLSDENHRIFLGDSTIVWWAETAEGECDYVDLFSEAISPKDEENNLKAAMESLTRGKSFVWNDTKLNPETTFYVLALAPNAARISVRFFLRDSFGKMLGNLNAHYERMEIVKPSFETKQYLSPYWMLAEMANQKSRDKKPPASLSGATLRSILNGTRYPAALCSGIMMRIRAEQTINWRRAGILKAYYLKNGVTTVSKEVFSVALNEQAKDVPYVLGRLFAVLENIQEEANPGINATIRDRYFNAACATPASIFVVLLKLKNNHIRKIKAGKAGLAVNLEKQVGQLLDLMELEPTAFPKRLNLEQQGAFLLGYYHQRQARFTKKKTDNKEEEENG